MKDRLQTGFIGFIYKNKITLVLTIVLFSLLKQNVIDNDFPRVVFEREKSIDKIRLDNANLSNENEILETRIESYTEDNLNLIESKARFKFGLIKEGEYFFKVNKIVETEALTENDEATL